MSHVFRSHQPAQSRTLINVEVPEFNFDAYRSKTTGASELANYIANLD
jgi:hypothetical protein